MSILTPERKAEIDASTYAELLHTWRFAPMGDQLLQGAAGDYHRTVMFRLRDADPGAAVQASKSIGWGR